METLYRFSLAALPYEVRNWLGSTSPFGETYVISLVSMWFFVGCGCVEPSDFPRPAHRASWRAVEVSGMGDEDAHIEAVRWAGATTGAFMNGDADIVILGI